MLKMEKGMFNYPLKIACLMISFLIAASICFVCAYAKETYISEVTIATGADGRTSLESKGYSVLFQGMNLVKDEGSMVFLGYKRGTDAITDFLVSTQRSSSITYGESSYKLVSSVSLNEGTGGTPIYLYYTKDSSAGGKITSLDTVSGFSDKDEVVSLRNDGSSPVRMNDGALANFDSGIDNNELYLLMYRSEDIKRYISNACIVTGSSKAAAVNSAVSEGCDYYLDYNISGGNKVSYIAYQRTADKSNAITEFSIKGSDLKFSKTKQSNSYLLDISNYKLFDKKFSLGDWAGVYASVDKSVSKTSAEYKALLNSKDSCSCVLAGDSNIYAVYLGELKTSVEKTTAAITVNVTQDVTNEDLPENSTVADATDEFYDIDKSETTSDVTQDVTNEDATENSTAADATDEFYDIDKSETTAEENDEESDGNNVASVFSKGNFIAIIAFSIITILILIGTTIYLKRRKKNDEKNN